MRTWRDGLCEGAGAGEGNRTLVFSLEGFRRLNTFKGHSDKNCHFHSLNANAFFALSERRKRPADTPHAAPGARTAGFRINALVSLLRNAGWGKLAAEFLQAKNDSDTLKVFINTVLGEPWREQADEIDDTALSARAEGFDLDRIPAEVLAITCGVDCQDDRLEASILGHARDGAVLVLAHTTIWGSPLDDDTWREIDALLRQRWAHPLGGQLKVDAAVIDCGDGGHYDAVMAFCNARLSRRILAGKGVAGFARPAIAASKTKKGRMFVIGVDGIKTQIINRLARGQTIRFSHTLDATYFEQLASERRVVRMSRGRRWRGSNANPVRGRKASIVSPTG
jgi:phage terminase large subunit GpA-like protein